MIRATSRSLALGLGLGLGCSSIAEPPKVEKCLTDDDCAEPLVCAVEQGGLCVPGDALIPVVYLGFDVQEAVAGQPQFRAEVQGCDAEIELDGESTRELRIRKNSLRRDFYLRVFSREPATPSTPSLDELLAADLELGQPSRFNRPPGLVNDEPHPLFPDDPTVPTVIEWPRYHPVDELPPRLDQLGYVLWTITPAPEIAAPRYQVLMPPRLDESRPCNDDVDCCDPQDDDCQPLPGSCVDQGTAAYCQFSGPPQYGYSFVYDNNCNRSLRGAVAAIDPLQSAEPVPVENASVTLRHADDPTSSTPFGLPPLDTLSPYNRAPAPCDSNDECLPDVQFCDPSTKHCRVRLAGLTAGLGTSLTDGQFDTRVYTYCEGLPNTVLERSFSIGVRPPNGLGLPSTTYDVNARFDPIGSSGPGGLTLDKPLCVPTAGPLRDFTIVPSGQPVTLLEGDDAVYECCDISCLPATAEDAATLVPLDPTACRATEASGGTTLVRFESQVAIDVATRAIWLADDSQCLPPVFGEGGAVGSIRETADCEQGEAGCTARVAVGEPDTPRTYRVRIESPEGSVLGSVDTEVELGTDSEDTLTVELPPRVLVRGLVALPPDLCDESRDVGCGSEGAVVIAERLAMDGEDIGNTPGPYFHDVSTFYDPSEGRSGAYVLPLDPGVYVITALPASGSRGGPAPIYVIDLRDRAPGEQVTQNFVLEPGVLVRLNVANFDRRSQVVPLDLGSWRYRDDPPLHPDRTEADDPSAQLIDLNRPGECLGASSDGTGDPQGCRIRRLTAGSSLALTQVGQVRFSLRESDDPNVRNCNR